MSGGWRGMRCSRCRRMGPMGRTGSGDAWRLRAGGAAGKRQQGDVAGALDGHAETALMPSANAGHAARENLAALLHELRQNVRALVVDEVHLLDTKLADFLFAEILALAAGTPPGAARTSRSAGTTATRPAFAPSASRTSFAMPASRAAFATRRSLW